LVEIEKSPRSLEELATAINAEHRAFGETFRKTVEHGIRCGELLAEAKGQVNHGGWLPWLEQNFEGSARTAQEYMRLYNRRDEIRAKTRSTAHLTITDALKELAAPERPGGIPPEEWEILERSSRDFPWCPLPDLTRPKRDGNPLEPERRRGFVAEAAWRAMMLQGTRYAEVLHTVQEDVGGVTPELVAELQAEADKLRWWVGRSERMEALVRACDWPPGGGMPEAAFDEEEKCLPMSALYAEYEDGLPDVGLPSPRARIREFCGPVV
jgi:hypothetical protein